MVSIDAAVDELASAVVTDPLALRLRWLDGKSSLAAKTLRAAFWQFRSEWRRRIRQTPAKNVCRRRGFIACHQGSYRRGPLHVGQASPCGLLVLRAGPLASPIIMQPIIAEKAEQLCCGQSFLSAAVFIQTNTRQLDAAK